MMNVEVKQGLVKSMPLPAGWKEFPMPDQGFALYSVREFRAADSINDDVTLCLYNRGLALDDASAGYFKNILAQKGHHLSSRELDQLDSVVQELADPETFSLLDARSEELNGRMVVLLEGRYVRSGIRMLRIYFDVKGDGRFVEEIFFSAPVEDYDTHVRAVNACVRAVVWE